MKSMVKSHNKKLAMLSKLSDTVKSKSPKQLTAYANSFPAEEHDEDEEDYPKPLVPENSHYFDSPENDQQDDSTLAKKMRMKKYRGSM